MEKLALCSKVLYDRDIIEKQKRILELEKKIEPPKVLYNSYKEYDEIRDEAFEVLEKKIIEIYDDNFEYEHMSHFGGITPGNDLEIEDAIHDCIFKISKNSDWSRTNAENIGTSLKSMFYAMINTNLWESFYNNTSQRKLSKFVFEIIRQNLDGNFSPGPILHQDIAQFKCKKCEKIVDCVEEDDTCIYCENLKK